MRVYNSISFNRKAKQGIRLRRIPMSKSEVCRPKQADGSEAKLASTKRSPYLLRRHRSRSVQQESGR